jgi:hypothetical protein
MALYIVRHQHTAERCPATDPFMGATLLNYLSRPNVRKYGIAIQGEAVVHGEHTLYMIVESSDETRIREFMRRAAARNRSNGAGAGTGRGLPVGDRRRAGSAPRASLELRDFALRPDRRRCHAQRELLRAQSFSDSAIGPGGLAAERARTGGPAVKPQLARSFEDAVANARGDARVRG